jgi:tetratricopeptide (TPR) repeat protein
MVIAPLLLLWDWMHRSEWSLSEILKEGERNHGVAIPVLVVCGLGMSFILVYAIPLSLTSPVGPFTYFYSQLGNAHHLFRFLFIPYQTALLHDLFFFRTPWHFEVLFGAILLIASLCVALRYRKHEFAFFLGAFILFMIPSNSLLAKNEVLREWRIYSSLPFLCFFLASVSVYIARAGGKRASLFARGVTIMLYVWIGFNIDSVRRQLSIYQTRPTTWQQMAKMYPYSADAFNNWGKALGEIGKSDEALPLFQKAVQRGPEASVYLKNLRTAQRSTGARTEARKTRRLLRKIKKKYGKKTLTIYFKENFSELEFGVTER